MSFVSLSPPNHIRQFRVISVAALGVGAPSKVRKPDTARYSASGAQE